MIYDAADRCWNMDVFDAVTGEKIELVFYVDTLTHFLRRYDPIGFSAFNSDDNVVINETRPVRLEQRWHGIRAYLLEVVDTLSGMPEQDGPIIVQGAPK